MVYEYLYLYHLTPSDALADPVTVTTVPLAIVPSLLYAVPGPLLTLSDELEVVTVPTVKDTDGLPEDEDEPADEELPVEPVVPLLPADDEADDEFEVDWDDSLTYLE